MQVEVGGLLVTCIANLFLGLIVGSRNWRARSNLSFVFLSASIAAWSAGIAIFTAESKPGGGLLFFINAYYIAALGIAFSLGVFASAWCGIKRYKTVVWLSIVMMISWILAIAVNPHSIVSSVQINGGNKHVTFNALGQTVYSLVFLAFFLFALNLLLTYRKNASKRQSRNTAIIVRGIVIAGTVGIICNLILPWFGNYSLVWVGPQFSVIFVGLIAFLIIRRRLFNIRLTIARSVAYLLALTAAITGYIVLVSIITSYSQLGGSLRNGERILFISLAVLTAITFHPIKHFFDKVTEPIFYRDLHDPQFLLDKLNDILVSAVGLDELLERTTKLLNKELKSSFVRFIFDSDFSDEVSKKYPLSDLDAHLINLLNEKSNKIILSDNQSPNDGSQRLSTILDNNQIALSAKLKTAKQLVGYMIVGYKVSGDGYLPQDMQVMGLISDELAISIQNVLRFEEIQHFNITLQQKVDEATRELRQTNRRLKLLDETKDDFISMASHQLRTPLTSVKGYISLVLDGDAGPIKPNQRKLLDQAYFSSQRMVFLIADLLNVSRLKTGKFIIEPTSVNLADIVDDEVKQLIETAEGRKLTLSYEKPAHFPMIDLDETKTRQVIMNFIDNAIYYTPAGGHISVTLSDLQRSIELKVIDDGIGVPREVQHHLFTKFFRATNAQKARPDGTGLGLFMAKKVIVAQGGAIIFSSQEGKGSVFGFTFPKTKHHDSDETPKTS